MRPASKMCRTLRSVLAIVLMLSFLSACSDNATPQAGPTPLPPVRADTRVIADGHVIPIHSADLRFGVTGTVGDVYLTLADEVLGAGIGKFPTATKKLGTLLA